MALGMNDQRVWSIACQHDVRRAGGVGACLCRGGIGVWTNRGARGQAQLFLR